MKLRAVLEEMIRRQGSDLHIFVGFPPVFRVNGSLQTMDHENVSPEVHGAPRGADPHAEAAQGIRDEPRSRLRLRRAGLGRFRANVCKQRGTIAMVFRLVPIEIPALESLALPPVIDALCTKPRGMILVTGITGSGKSTTLAAMLQKINQERRDKIVTIEDPIEFCTRAAPGSWLSARSAPTRTRSRRRCVTFCARIRT